MGLFDGDIVLPGRASFTIPENPVITTAKSNYASEFYKRLVEWINKYETGLDPEHEVGVRLVSFGREVIFHLTSISYWNPSLIKFEGTLDDGTPVELIQHVTQISILLTKVNRTKGRLGFRATEEQAEPQPSQP